jgi:hypothetical protein
MANWPRVSLPQPMTPAFGFAASTMRAAVNSYGLIELFVSDSSGNVWHINQYRRPERPASPFGEPLSVIAWGPWTNFGTPVPVPWWQNSFSLPTTFTVATNADGRIEVFSVGYDGNPYHMYQIPQPPDVDNIFNTYTWSAWSAMTPGPTAFGPGIWIENYWPVARNLNGRIVVCYFDATSTDNQNVYYDYQVPDPTQVGGMGWASVSNNGLFSIPLPAPQNQGFWSIALVRTVGGLWLLALSELWGMGAGGYYATMLASPTGVWSPWQAVPPARLSNLYPQIFPNGQFPYGVSDAISYLSGGAAALFFTDSSGSLTVLRQVLTEATPGSAPQATWNDAYDSELPLGSVRNGPFNAAVAEDRFADAHDPTNLHQTAFFARPDGLSLLALNFQVPATVPAGAAFWPTTYEASPASPVTIDDGSAGAFTSLDQVFAISVPNGPIVVFGLTNETGNVYCWTQSS